MRKMAEEKFNVKLTFLIGLAFFTTAIAWSLYNTQVNLRLRFYLPLLGLIGFWMALDNIIGVILQPIMGSVSDNTRSRYGRRMPYIMIGIPLAAVFFALIPTETSFGILLLWMFCFVISMAFYRSQAVALMPDFIKPEHRSKGNAIINMMGGIGSVVAFTLSFVTDIIGLQAVFIIVSVIMVVALIVLLLTVKESEAYSFQLILKREEELGEKIKEERKKVGLIESIRDIFSEEDKSTLIMLLAIFFMFIGYQAAEALFTIYGVEVLALSSGFAGFMFNFVGIPFIIFAFPAGIIATKIGRRLAIKIGLALMIISLLLCFLIQQWIPTAIFFVIFGIGYALVNVNTIVVIWQMAPTERKIGTYTGVYYFFSFLAAIIGPGIVGAMTDLFTTPTLLLNCSFFVIVSFILMFFVKRGEVELTEEEKRAKQKAIQEL